MTPPLSRLEDYAALREDFSPEAWEGLRRSFAVRGAATAPKSRQPGRGAVKAPPAPDPAYFLATYFAYQSVDAQDRLLGLLRKARAPALMVWEMERSAKARGRGDFGRALHRLFLDRHRAQDYLELPVADDSGDGIFFPKEGPTARTWAQVGWSYAPERPDLSLARALALFVSVEWQGPFDAPGLGQVLSEAEQFRERGLPLPPRLVLHGDAIPAGSRPEAEEIYTAGTYDKTMDTLSLVSRNPQLTVTWAHEAGHFLMDLLDDRHGPNDDYLAPLRAGGELLFDPARCGLWEHVSTYPAAYCRLGSSPLARDLKMGEDLAETFAYAYTRPPDPASPPGPAHDLDRWQELSPASILEGLEGVLNHLLRDPERLPLRNPSTGLDPISTQRLWETFSRQLVLMLGAETPAPPRLSAEVRTWDLDYMRAMQAWLREVRTKHLPEVERRRLEKVQWMDRLIAAWVETDLAPWELGLRLGLSGSIMDK